MKLITFQKENGDVRAGWIHNTHYAVDMHEASKGELPENMLAFLEHNDVYLTKITELEAEGISMKGVYPLEKVTLLAPLPFPKSFRDFYAFEQHVKTARANRGLEMIPEWYEIPVFYFSNHLAIKGTEEEIKRPDQCEWLDYELEVGCVIGKKGRDIQVADAERHIFGYCILNDWSARDLQRQEMKVGLGPAKGKDFSTSIGPYILTKDELDSFQKDKGFDLKMTARVNGQLLSVGNMSDLHYSFAEMIARASADVTLYPGELIGSGTVGTGCILELGEDIHRWLQPGDEVELEIEKLGVLRNRIV
ncbi:MULTISPECIES: fumarylacetoacetate hydrolase family protein [unclassified Bacillus (in: firmicutes)]|uniref:fumarylacetoacetate hydrolase family protein n=1 Tax=unclassified Bacillus (in: firmicutes) TaxID=185979 RepID=UPI0008DEDD76|nr:MULTISPECIES: fumarylacetoacetate hydrolase family protein [unclassified Bacillus (in: firmicutes)]SFA88606.1 2-keto-4-pentenoate hydratase/2-oxohepta-3-ene-1,7-dioic acid hydratase (catechol pathway) [Bacillus sp. UNCCL13]SFQ84652.1 2-keto-4-pentenoate hydratase/2-oxohepta-3-ene-1,7-dioic acid hydratase (catechol pathway) [Bacillus sp. cl95]